MDYLGIIIVGTSGSGKSTIAKLLCELNTNFEIVTALTTREPRSDDFNYEYITDTEFEQRKLGNEFIVKAFYRDKKYAISQIHLNNVLIKEKIPVLIITPESTSNDIIFNLKKVEFLTYFIDTSDEELSQRISDRNDGNNIKYEEEIKQRNNDREYKNNSTYNILNKNNELVPIVELIIWLWTFRNVGGVLPHQIISSLIKYASLIESDNDINEDNISASSFDLTLGNSYFQNGKIKQLQDNEPNIIIQPGDFIIAGSKEKVNMPPSITGRFDLTVSMFCKGLILSNGPQVDPGFSGILFCLLFNTSNEKIELRKGEHYATIEFSKLICYTDKPYRGKYQKKEKLFEYLPQTAKISVISQIIEDISKLKKESILLKYLPIIISSAALVVAILKLAK